MKNTSKDKRATILCDVPDFEKNDIVVTSTDSGRWVVVDVDKGRSTFTVRPVTWRDEMRWFIIRNWNKFKRYVRDMYTSMFVKRFASKRRIEDY